MSVGIKVYLCCGFADYQKSWRVLFELILGKTHIVWLHRKYYFSQHERKADCDNSVAPLTVTVIDDRGWCFYLPKKHEKHSHSEFLCPLNFTRENKIIFSKFGFFGAHRMISILTRFSLLKTICITRQYEKG